MPSEAPRLSALTEISRCKECCPAMSLIVQVLCRFSDAGKTCSPRAHAAGVRKAPRHEIAVCRAPGVAASAMGIWAGRACPCDLMAAVRMIALGHKIAESILDARPVRCASGV